MSFICFNFRRLRKKVNAVETGDYTIYFSTLDHKIKTTLAIEFEWKTDVDKLIHTNHNII